MIRVYMTDDITIMKWEEYDDKWKEPKDPTNKDVKGRFEFKTRLTKNLEGEEVVSRATVYFHSSIDSILGRALIHEDMIKYNVVKPNTQKYTILNIETPKAFSDPHYEVFLA